MPIYAVWNNKGGVGKSYLSFQIAAEIAHQRPDTKVLVVDLCPQANVSSMLLGGVIQGEVALEKIHAQISPRRTIAGYFEDRIRSPYIPPQTGAQYLTTVSEWNEYIPQNLHLVVGDEHLELQSSRVSGATYPGPQDAWRIVHLWVRDMIQDILESWNHQKSIILIDCNPSFSIYTQMALIAADRLIIPFSADGSSKRAVKAVLSLVYGITRQKGDPKSEFFLKTEQYRMALPQIYTYVGNRLTQMNQSSALAFKTIVQGIGDEIWRMFREHPTHFCVHPQGAHTPTSQKTFRSMFQYEVNDANTASVVSSTLGIPITQLTAGKKDLIGKSVMVNQTQLDRQAPNLQALVKNIS